MPPLKVRMALFFHFRSIVTLLTIKFTVTCDNSLFVASLTQLISSWPRDLQETFLLVSEQDFGCDAQRVCQAEG